MIIIGKVVKTAGRGTKLGFPTANLNIHRPVPRGVYLAQISIHGLKCKGLAFIGQPKTFNDPHLRLEVHIPDFKKNLYNQYISVKLLTKIRDNKKFQNKEALIKQIKKDLQIFKAASTLNEFRA